MSYVDTLPRGIANYRVGQQGCMRGLLAKSYEAGNGNFLYAFELLTRDGPWINKENYKKFNAVLRYSQNTGNTRFNITAMGHGGNWNATDQIPQHAVTGGLIPRLGAIDPSDGGESHRFSLSAALQHTSNHGVTRANLYTIHSNLALFSNFTYFLDDPINGDQFSQTDKRFQSAFNLSHTWINSVGRLSFENLAGVQVQNDVIDNGLLSPKQRRVLLVTRKDHVLENSIGLYYQNSVQWLEKFPSVTGVRSDFYWFDINSNIGANSGRAYDSITNPKLSLIFGPWVKTEYYLNYGSWFHSNDARGVATTVDPKSGEPVSRVHLLVRYFGKRPLVEDNSIQSGNTVTVNGQIGIKIDKKFRVMLQVFNLFNTRAHAIDYYYTSRLPGEPSAGVADRHFHPIESRSFRINLVGNF